MSTLDAWEIALALLTGGALLAGLLGLWAALGDSQALVATGNNGEKSIIASEHLSRALYRLVLQGALLSFALIALFRVNIPADGPVTASRGLLLLMALVTVLSAYHDWRTRRKLLRGPGV